MANSMITKYVPNPAIEWLSNQEDISSLPARSFITNLWTMTVLQSINMPKLKKNKIKKEWRLPSNHSPHAWSVTIYTFD